MLRKEEDTEVRRVLTMKMLVDNLQRLNLEFFEHSDLTANWLRNRVAVILKKKQDLENLRYRIGGCGSESYPGYVSLT